MKSKALVFLSTLVMALGLMAQTQPRPRLLLRAITPRLAPAATTTRLGKMACCGKVANAVAKTAPAAKAKTASSAP